jgi:hypothetical protein
MMIFMGDRMWVGHLLALSVTFKKKKYEKWTCPDINTNN